MKINITRVHEGISLPRKSLPGDAGYDLHTEDPIILGPMQRACVSTGLCIEIPEGYYGRIAPRSGLAVDKGLHILGGIIDSSYRGEIKIIIINLNLPSSLFEKKYNSQAWVTSVNSEKSSFGCDKSINFYRGDRIAQLIIEKCQEIEWEEVDQLGESFRGSKGFGSTGFINS